MSRKLTTLVLLLGLLAAAAVPSAAVAAYGLTSVGGNLQDEGGAPLLRAGAHPTFDFTFRLHTVTSPESGLEVVDGNPRDVEVTLPPGLVGNPTATPKCTHGEIAELGFSANCDPSTQIGIATVYTGGPSDNGFTEPIYNLVPPRGVAGEFGFNVVGSIVYLDSKVTADGEYHLETDVSQISQGLAVSGSSVELWANPASPSHNFERAEKGGGLNPTHEEIIERETKSGKIVYEHVTVPTEVRSNARPVALFTNPTTCSGSPLQFGVATDSWRAPGVFSTGSYSTDPQGNPLTINGCDRVPFEASIKAQPSTQSAESPTGFAFDLHLPQNQLPEGTASANLREAVVTLPEGMSVDPASAAGLGTCSEGQIGLGNDDAPACPGNSRIGDVSIATPLLEAPLEGGVYLAQQHSNKFGSLLALYLAVDDPVTGTILKIPGKVDTDAASGRLTARFEDAPQLPFEDLTLTLYGGQHAALQTPSACGSYSTSGTFTPWSGGPAIVASDSFQITSGPEGTACPSGGFGPTLSAGTANPAAGVYSPFELQISRGDGNSRLGGVSVTLPKGLLAKLAGIPYCSDATLASIPTGEGSGAGQLAAPSCPAASRVGSVAVAAGAGQSPFWVKTGSAYLAGPYKGAPLSLALVTPAVAGPFDLGNVVVRTALGIDPVTAQVSATSDPLPTILDGIPLSLRDVRVKFDRSDFTLNPTSCAPQQVSSLLTSVGGAKATPSVPFAATSCGGLGFAPKLALSLNGGTKRGAFPRLTATVKAQAGQANLSRVAVALPSTEFLAQEHIKTVCTRVQYAADQCPANSIYGYAEAMTPLLGQPLRGPVYLRSSSHTLPDLAVALRGQIDIDLDGRIDSHKRSIRTTFESIPDAPISSFVLRLKGGKKSLLVNSASLCAKHAPKAQVSMLGQNGERHQTGVPLAARCGHPAPGAGR